MVPSKSRPQSNLFFFLLFLTSSFGQAVPHVASSGQQAFVDATDTPEAVGNPSCSRGDTALLLDASVWVRGGSSAAEATVETYLESVHQIGFYVQGWRWHNLSLVRDTSRLEKLALHLLRLSRDGNAIFDEKNSVLDAAAAHVIDFNLRGLFRIEDELFFPWLREKLCGNSALGTDLRGEFQQVLDGIDEDRQQAFQMGKTVREKARIASCPDAEPSQRLKAIANVAQLSGELNSRIRDIIDREDRLIVPAIAAVVPVTEQKSFNNKVIRKLGILDSRVHLVGMYDAVWEGPNTRERQIFEETIPYLARTMIPRWRKVLYEPQAGVLDLGK